MPSNRPQDLDPVVAAIAVEHERRANAAGIPCVIRHTLRSILEHEAIWAQGREDVEKIKALRFLAGLYELPHDKYKTKVTWTLKSMHLYGCAYHLVLKLDGVMCWDVNADINENERSDYEELGRIGEEMGCTWGVGDPKRDLVHYEFLGGFTKDEIRQGRRPVEVMAIPTYRESKPQEAT